MVYGLAHHYIIGRNKNILMKGAVLLSETILYVNYFIDGIISTIPTKMVYEQLDENEFRNIHYEVSFGKHNIISKTCHSIEYATAYLQKSLPSNVSIACCQSCRHGNFCPYGNIENEIFCLKDITPNDKRDVCDFFDENSDSIKARSRKLLDFCKEYKPISNDKYYTYNDWKCNF
jgi:hypothetical protein